MLTVNVDPRPKMRVLRVTRSVQRKIQDLREAPVRVTWTYRPPPSPYQPFLVSFAILVALRLPGSALLRRARRRSISARSSAIVLMWSSFFIRAYSHGF